MDTFIKIAIVLFLAAGCNDPSSTDGDSRLALDVEVNSEKISTLQDLEVNITASNVTQDTLIYKFSSSCQAAFSIRHNFKEVFSSENVLFCLQYISSLKLEPKESKTYTFQLEGLTQSDTLNPGTYQIEGYLLNDKSPIVKTSFVVE